MKKVLNGLFAFVLALGMVPLAPAGALAAQDEGAQPTQLAPAQASQLTQAQPQAAAVWTGAVDIGWYSAAASEFTLTTPEQLAGLATIVNGTASGIARDDFTGKTVKLGADVALNSAPATQVDDAQRAWTPIGYLPITGYTEDMPNYDDSRTFNGTFDGQGHTVANIYLANPEGYGGYSGLFGSLGGNAVVRDLGMEGGFLYGRVVGAVAAVSHVTDSAQLPQIIGCYSSVTIVGNGATTRGAGGIFGGEEQFRTSTTPNNYHGACIISGCYNTGSVRSLTGGGAAGGIAGIGSVVVRSCYNAGAISSDAGHAAALVGALVTSGRNVGQNSAASYDAFGSVHHAYAVNGTASALYYIMDADHDYDHATATTQNDDSGFKATSMLRADDLGASFEDASGGGLPQLYWQAGAARVSMTDSASRFTIEDISSQYYTGKPVQPELYVYYSSPLGGYLRLYQDADFTVTYSNNVEAGTATATVHGKGRFTGQLAAVTFTIIDTDLSTCTVSPIPAQWFYGDPVEPAVTVYTRSGDQLYEGVDFYVTYADNTREGTASATLRPYPNTSVRGTKTVYFQVVAASASLEGQGSETSPFLLKSKQDLQFVAHQLNTVKAENSPYANAYYKMANDIDATATSAVPAPDPWGWGSGTPGFSGTFDGDGKTLTLGLTSAGLSSECADSSWNDVLAFISQTGEGDVTIKDLLVEGSVVSDAQAAGLVGYAQCEHIAFQNVTNAARVVAGTDGMYSAGGFLDYMLSYTNAAFTRCNNTGEVMGYNAGGFVGMLYGVDGTLQNCTNTGRIVSYAHAAGGLVGSIYGSGSTRLHITRCANTGAVEATGNNTAGGLVGWSYNTISLIEIAESYNTGALRAYQVGGLLGWMNRVYDIEVTDSYNTGDITAIEGESYTYPGGIAGILQYSTMTTENVYSAGAITQLESDAKDPGALVGLVGWGARLTIANSYYDSSIATQDTRLSADSQSRKTGEGIATSTADMKSAAMPGKLGGKFAQASGEDDNKGYPVLVASGSATGGNLETDCTVSDIADREYTGSRITPGVTVYTTANPTRLYPGVDYRVSYSDNVNVGQVTVTVVGIGSWTGTVTKTFNITKADIANCVIADIADAYYIDNPGGPFEPAVTVVNGAGNLLKEGTDFTVSYSGNTTAGEAQAVVAGQGNYQGTLTAGGDFYIEPGDIAACSVSGLLDAYDFAAPAGPAVLVKVATPKGYELRQGTDYRLTYLDAQGQVVNSWAAAPGGAYTVSIASQGGNWKNAVARTFAYGKDIAAGAAMSGVQATYAYTGEAIAVTPALTDAATGAALDAGEYAVSFLNSNGAQVAAMVDPGTYTVVVKATGATSSGTPSKWYGERTARVSVAVPGFLIDDSCVTGIAGAYAYTGRPVPVSPVVKVNGATLTQGTNYRLTFTDASGKAVTQPTAAGTYTVTVEGIGNYVGVVTRTFSIVVDDQGGQGGDQGGSGGQDDPDVPGVDRTALRQAIAAAQDVQEGVAVSALSGADVPKNVDWVTSNAQSALEVAVASAQAALSNQAATQAQVDSARASLVQATAAYEAAKAPGKKATVWKRLAGETALGTMQEVVEAGFDASDVVVVATVDGYWDALAASALAGRFSAPVLLTASDGLSAEASAEIRRLGATRAYIVGGAAAVSSVVESQVRATLAGSADVKRLGGENAVDTARVIAAEVGSAHGDTCFVATSDGYWDALAASPYAYAKCAPVYLTDAEGNLSDDTLAAIAEAGYSRAVIAGGTAVVSDAAESRLRAIGVPAVTRLGGADAYDTAGLIARWELSQGMSADGMGVATAGGYWDALTGAALCGVRNAVLVLADDGHDANLSVAREGKATLANAYVFGGTAAVSAAVMSSCEAATL